MVYVFFLNVDIAIIRLVRSQNFLNNEHLPSDTDTFPIHAILHKLGSLYGTKCSRVDQVKFVEDLL